MASTTATTTTTTTTTNESTAASLQPPAASSVHPHTSTTSSTSGGSKVRSTEELLQAAYGDEYGKTGHDLAGHSVGDADVETLLAKGRGSSLLYGELLPAGAVALARALFERRRDVAGPILELGMGTGKVALQYFLSLNRDVYGVELAPSRWKLADDALRKLAELEPNRFQYQNTAEGRSRLQDLSTNCSCEFQCGSLLDTPDELLTTAAAVVMEVCLPKDVQRLACSMLQRCSTGCRIVCYAPFHSLVENCRMAPVNTSSPDGEDVCGDGVGGLKLAASWKECGHGFAFYEVAADASAAQAAWATALEKSDVVQRAGVDPTGNPSRARKTKFTDDVLPVPNEEYPWKEGDKVLVGWSWLPFLDLGNPGEDSDGGLNGVTWMAATILALDKEGFATICYEDDGTVEEQVHPERIRNPNC
eukprot:CAMPEP_0206491634 /NCGR_PEP_ID=MMETSP0324_2-20121206/45225_1 /ASSEMBLY_ACC=CAM_ASM_000836 /TAXON_ID=2866 /ORGANISM="Crypthecodinium cohnii, Strain Seligo" /LENGTH=418 /DNA_ID=CAMNT_0053973087 /DNA_START=135 /DNA_END=1388 /DNA_ORIENTATION=+